MGRPFTLETFDGQDSGVDQSEAAVAQAWQDGHAAGLSEAHNQGLADIMRGQDQLVQTLQDMAFGYAEARETLLRDLIPLFEASCSQFFPTAARAALVPQVVEVFGSLAEKRMKQPLRLAVPPDQLHSVTEALAAHPDLPFQAEADSTLGPHQVIIAGGAQDMMVDLDGLIGLVQSSFEAVTEIADERQEHG